MSIPVKTDDKKKDASSFKFEANISVFGTEVDLKPLEGDEIGYRAPAGEDGIAVSQTALIKAGIIEKDGTASKIIPSTTYVKAIVFNKKTKKVEFAAKAMFYGPAETTGTDKADIKGWATTPLDTDGSSTTKQTAALASLKAFAQVRGIVIPAANQTDFATISKYFWVPAKAAADGKPAVPGDLTPAIKAFKGFILNQYPQVFTVNSVSIYVGPEAPKEATPAVKK
jgi:hypothetical protein